jgi:cobyrinic acid a,c-diamide synthase
MMALFDNLVDKEGQTHRMAGLLPGTVTMQNDWRQSAIRPLSYLRGKAWSASRYADTRFTTRPPTLR